MTNITETHPLISEDWDYQKNDDLNPNQFVMSDKKSVWWKCKKGHSYQVSIYSRVRSNGCKVCGRAETEDKKNINRLNEGKSFSKKFPDLIKEWDYQKNGTIPPDMVTWGSKKKVWWKCTDNHSWLATPYSRGRGSGCPECSQKIVGEKTRKTRLSKSGSLAEKFPILLNEWDFERNNIQPTEVSPFSNWKAYWVCKFNHKWSAKIHNRTIHGSGCPECNPQSSKIEIYILCELRSIFPNTEWRKKFNGVECDIYIPEINIGLEIDGGYWHKDKLIKDEQKNDFFKDIDIQLVRVRDKSLPQTSVMNIQFTNGEDLQQITNRLFNFLLSFDAKFRKYKFNQSAKIEYKKMISRLPAPSEGETLSDTHPEIADEWDYQKNYPLTPDLFSYGSQQDFFWICPENHSFESIIKNRTINKSGCPACYKNNSSIIAMRGKLKHTVSLQEENPDYLNMFDSEKNSFNPSDIPLMSTKKLWWKCENQHFFQRTAASMSVNQSCPECSRLVFSHPEIAMEFHPAKNIDIDIRYLDKGSSKKVWWICKRRHEWERDVGSRVREKSGCPHCFNQNRSEIMRKSSVRRVGSLQSQMPDFLNLWDYDKNQIQPSEVTTKSDLKVWWKCLKGHPPYEQSVLAKTTGQNCPVCANEIRVEKMRVSRLKKFGSFKENHPELIQYWDKIKNKSLDPSGLTSGSKERVHWVCSNHHNWVSSLNTMTAKRRLYICPLCKNPKKIKPLS